MTHLLQLPLLAVDPQTPGLGGHEEVEGEKTHDHHRTGAAAHLLAEDPRGLGPSTYLPYL